LSIAILIAAGAVLVLAVVGVVGVNLYVQSAGTQKRIEQALSSGLKVPVHVTNTIVTPWSGLKASGITIPQIAPAAGNFLDAASFTARVSWMGLMKHRLDASDVSLESPRVTWFQSPGGKWELPRPKVAAAPKGAPTAPVSPVETPAKPEHPWDITVHNLSVNDASFGFWDEKGMKEIEFSGVHFDCPSPTVTAATGHASCKDISLHDRLFFRDMSTNWSFTSGTAKLADFETEVGGGSIRGDATVATQAKHSPFTVDVTFDHVDANQLMIEAGETPGQLNGMLKGSLDLSGNSGKRSSINGSGHFELTGGRMLNIEVLQMLGQGLQIPDLVQLDLKTAVADFRVVSGVTNVDRLVLQSQNLRVDAHGTVGSDGKLNLDARLTINGPISEKLTPFIGNYFKVGDTSDSRYIDFAIGNTLSHPRTTLLDTILAHRIKDQMNDFLLNTFFGKKHSKQTAPAPETSPANP
jgi:type II secretion system protein N